jgi:hypothetical protein
MKRLGCFSILVFGILLLMHNVGAQTHMKSPIIGIQYVGPSDKPVTPIIIDHAREDARRGHLVYLWERTPETFQ